MRQAGVAKMGFMPTPDSQVEKIVKHLSLGEQSDVYRLLDPCAGEGAALRDVKSALRKEIEERQLTGKRYDAHFCMNDMSVEEIQAEMHKKSIPYQMDEFYYTFILNGLTEEQKRAAEAISDRNGSTFYLAKESEEEVSRVVLSYGIELDKARAAEAATVLDHVVPCGYEQARTTKGAFSLLFLNPPYDHTAVDDELPSMRKERVFLRDTVEYLAPDGILIYIIPQHRLTKEVATTLAWRFEDFAVFRFEDGEYEIYKQIVVVGRRKRKSGIQTDAEKTAFRFLQSVGLEQVEVPILGNEAYQDHHWVVPPSPVEQKEFMFRGSILDPNELAKDLERSSVWKTLSPMISLENQKVIGGQPLLPLKKTHLGTIIAAGATDGVIGIGENRHMLVGLTRKVIDKETEVDDYNNVKEIERERFLSAVKVYTPDGLIKELN